MANVSSSNSQGELVPRLRFPGFEGEWEAKELGDLLMFQNGINAPAEKYGKGIKYISVMDILNNTFITYDRIRGLVDIDDQTLKNYSVEYGDIVFQRSSETPEDIGHSNVYLDDRTATFGGFVIRGKKTGDYNPLFFKYLLDSGTARKEIIRIGQGAQHYNIGQEGLRKISLYFPKESEQKKIARILELIDTNIGLHTALIMALKSYKRGLIFALFQPNNRFSIPMAMIPMRSLLKEYRVRETDGLRVCSVAVEKGVIDQVEHLGRSFAASDTSKYGRVEPDYIIYTKSPTGDFPYGIVKQNRLTETVAVSPLYGVYKPRTPADGTLLHYYFEQHENANNYIRTLAQKGAKNTINITTDKFLDKDILFPKRSADINKLVCLFNVLNTGIEAQKYLLEVLTEERKTLLSQLFI